jgi:tetratricopeptide (TPR) repeat protein
METKDLLSLALALAAFCLSIYATLTAQRKSVDERQRTIRGQLTDILAKLTALQLEAAKLQHEAKDDLDYLLYVNNVLGQQNGFFLDQAVYLSEQIPSLVTTYELNTIALANTNAGNFLQAERYYLKAIEIAPSDRYKALAVRSYASFLYPQGRLNEGREQFRRALDLMKGEDNLARWSKGYTYQMWGVSEISFARSQERANEHFENARREYASIDVDSVRNQAFASLDAAQYSSGLQPPVPNVPLQTDTPLNSAIRPLSN